GVPDLAGRLCECLWAQSTRREATRHEYIAITQVDYAPDVKNLLCTGKKAQMHLLIGIKEGRLNEARCSAENISYMEMCEILSRALPTAWMETRKLHIFRTADADRVFAGSVLKQHRDAVIITN
ncbi:unnamed protein product, partial [Polarella glacialis]